MSEEIGSTNSRIILRDMAYKFTSGKLNIGSSLSVLWKFKKNALSYLKTFKCQLLWTIFCHKFNLFHKRLESDFYIGNTSKGWFIFADELWSSS